MTLAKCLLLLVRPKNMPRRTANLPSKYVRHMHAVVLAAASLGVANWAINAVHALHPGHFALLMLSGSAVLLEPQTSPVVSQCPHAQSCVHARLSLVSAQGTANSDTMILHVAVVRSGEHRQEPQTATKSGSLYEPAESDAEPGGSKRRESDGGACTAHGVTSGKSPHSSMTPHKRSLAARTLPAHHEVCSNMALFCRVVMSHVQTFQAGPSCSSPVLTLSGPCELSVQLR